MQVFLLKKFLEIVFNVIQELCGIILYRELKFVRIGRNIVLLSFKCKIEYDYRLYVYIIDKKNFLFGVLYII